MNLYRVRVGTTPEGKPAFEDVKAGALDIEAGCLIFRRTVGTNDIIMAYKSWDSVMRVKKDIDEHS